MPGYEVIGDEELTEIRSVFSAGGVLVRHGFDVRRNGAYKVAEFEREFAAYMGAPYALGVTSGTAALRVALAALGIGRGDSVLIPAFTFVATAEAVIEAGAIPVCVEVDETLNIDPADLERRIRSDSRAVIAVHMLGTPADISRIREICDRNSLDLIEDTAWGCGGAVDDKKLGTWGRIGTFSFDFAKTLTTGEGGMLVFSREDDFKAAAAWHDHGHENNPQLPRWEDSRTSSGFNYRMNELQGAVGLAQLRKLDRILEGQRQHHSLLRAEVEDIPGVQIRTAPLGSSATDDALIFTVPTAEAALRCRSELVGAGIGTKILPEAVSWHFAGDWTHMPEIALGVGTSLEDAFPTTRALLARSVAIPVSADLDARPGPGLRNAIRDALDSE